MKMRASYGEQKGAAQVGPEGVRAEPNEQLGL